MNARRNAAKRAAAVVLLAMMIALVYVSRNGYWWPTSDVFVLAGGIVWVSRMYYLESKEEAR